MKSEDLSIILRDCRVNKGFTQSELGARMNQDRTWVSKVENGNIVPDMDEVVTWAHITDGADMISGYVAQRLGGQISYEQVIEIRTVRNIIRTIAEQFA